MQNVATALTRPRRFAGPLSEQTIHGSAPSPSQTRQCENDKTQQRRRAGIVRVDEANRDEADDLNRVADEQERLAARLVHKANGDERGNEVDQPDPDGTAKCDVGVAGGVFENLRRVIHDDVDAAQLRAGHQHQRKGQPQP